MARFYGIAIARPQKRAFFCYGSKVKNDVGPHPYEPKYFLNGFPKSGLHLAVMMLLPVSLPMPHHYDGGMPWAGTFEDNAWSVKWRPLEKILCRIGLLQSGHFLKAHAGYNRNVERFLYYLGVSHVFVYRDFRDVSVSAAHHILSQDDRRHQHPGKDEYRALGDFEEILKAVIVGHGRWPGLFERWEMYAPWLETGWIHKVRFEDMRLRPREAARGILEYGLARIASVFGDEVDLGNETHEALIDSMVEMGQQRDMSPTFRKGNVGDWREHFSAEIKETFKAADKDGWLVRLGYEENGDW